MQIDEVLIYYNDDGLAEAVYQLESPKQFKTLLEENKYKLLARFNQAKRDLVERDIELILWEVNFNQKDLLGSLASVLYSESEVTKK